MPKIKTSEIDFFMSKVKKDETDEDGCWEWTGNIDMNGYGRFKWQNARMSAHRTSLRLHRGMELGADDIVCHLCRNRRCVNPDHLQVADVQENTKHKLKDWDQFCKDNPELIEQYTAIKAEIAKTYRNWIKRVT